TSDRASCRDPCLEGPNAGRNHRTGARPRVDRGPLRRLATVTRVRCGRDSALDRCSVASEPATAVELEQEQKLVEEAQQGNLDAMRPILERYAAPLYGTVILPRLGDTASAEEVLRDTLATAVEKIRRFTWQGKSIYPWLRQIAINKVYDVHRQAKRSRRLADARIHEVSAQSDPASHAEPRPTAHQGSAP